MKNRNLVIIIAALCMIIMGACFSPWDGSGEQGNIVINVGNSGARLAAGDVKDYIITLTNSGETSISKTTAGGTVDFAVSPGNWNILVRAMGIKSNSAGGYNNDNRELKGYGEANAEVKAGVNTDVTVTVKAPENGVTDMVSAWTDLKDVLEGAGRTETVKVLLTRNLQVNSSIEIRNGSNITLVAEKPVIITKGNVVANSLFRVIWGSTLTLDKIGQGTITVDGCGYKPNNSSLFYVGTTSITSNTPPNPVTSGTLIMKEGVTLTNNYATIDDRGGAVVVDGGTFRMEGGEISGNTATFGGGVLILNEGTFNQTKGKIYGSNEGSNSNTATNKDGGHAVAVGSVTVNNATGKATSYNITKVKRTTSETLSTSQTSWD